MEAESTAGESPRSTPSRLNAGFSGKVAAKKAGLELEPEPYRSCLCFFLPHTKRALPKEGSRYCKGSDRCALALAELRALAGFLQAVLLALDHTGVAREETGLLELGTIIAGIQEGAADAVAQSAGLA